jgi:hypothetical protein
LHTATSTVYGRNRSLTQKPATKSGLTQKVDRLFHLHHSELKIIASLLYAIKEAIKCTICLLIKKKELYLHQRGNILHYGVIFNHQRTALIVRTNPTRLSRLYGIKLANYQKY